MQYDVNWFDISVFKFQIEIDIGDSDHYQQCYQDLGVHSHGCACKINVSFPRFIFSL